MPQENKINLSIIIPVYNEDQYLKTLFNQIIKFFNNKSIELIFVDDGSTDSSAEILASFEKNSNYNFNLKIVSLEKNSGKGKAIQVGINNSSGEYILLLPS